MSYDPNTGELIEDAAPTNINAPSLRMEEAIARLEEQLGIPPNPEAPWIHDRNLASDYIKELIARASPEVQGEPGAAYAARRLRPTG